MVKISITENQGNQRLDRFLKKYLDNAPLSMIYRMIRKDIKVNGKRAREDSLIQTGDELQFYLSEEELKKLQKVKKVGSGKGASAKKQFKIAYEDEHILVAVKPFGLLTHGDQNEKKNHLLNQVIDYLIEKGDYNPRAEKTFTPAAVNRLDRNTTGLVLFGKDNVALQELSALIREKDAISKKYKTIVYGKLEKELILRDRMQKDESKNLVSVSDLQSGEGKLMETIVKPIKTGQAYGRWYSLRLCIGQTPRPRTLLH